MKNLIILNFTRTASLGKDPFIAHVFSYRILGVTDEKCNSGIMVTGT